MEKVISDSGIIQKESCFLNVHCVTLTLEVKWVSTLRNGKNRPVKKRKKNNIIAAVKSKRISNIDNKPFGKSNSAEIMKKTILNSLN